MKRVHLVPLAVLLSFCAVAAAAAPPAHPASAETVDAEARRFGIWLQRINAAIEPAEQAFNNFGNQVGQLTSGLSDKATWQTSGAAVRAAVAGARSRVAAAQASLAAIPPFRPASTLGGGVNPDTVLAESRQQMIAMLSMLDDCDALGSALEKGDADGVRTAAPKLVRGGMLMIDGRMITLRNRQAAVSPRHSSHQALGIGVAIYRAMGAAIRASVRARIDHQPEQAATDRNTQYQAIADETEAAVKQGRANLVREHGEVRVETLRAKDNRTVADLRRRAEGVLANEEKLFLLGDQLVAWLRANARAKAEDLTTDRQPDDMAQLAAFEEQFVAASRAEAAVLAGSGG
jgi:hypothetical protein